MPTRKLYRQRFSQDLRAFKPDEGGTATTGTKSTLVQAAWPIQQNIDESDEFVGNHLLRPNAATAGDRVRMIDVGSYAPRTGTFTPSLPYTLAPVVGGGEDTDTLFELHGHGFEPWAGVDLLINAALLDIHVVATIPFAPRVSTSGNYAYNLTDGDGSGSVLTRIAALTQPSWVHAIDLQPAATRQIQTITVANGSTSTITITYRGYSTTALATTTTAAAMQTALRLLPGLEAVTVDTGATTTPNFTYTVTMTGAPQQSPKMSAVVTSQAGTTTVVTAITTETGIAVPQRGKIDLDGNHVIFYADRHYDSGDVLYIRCRLPALAWCRQSASAAWGSLIGLGTGSLVASSGAAATVVDTQEAQPPVEWVSAAMQVWGWKRRPDLMSKGVDQRGIASQAVAQAEFDKYQADFQKRVVVSRYLTFPVEGGGGQGLESPLRAISQDAGSGANSGGGSGN